MKKLFFIPAIMSLLALAAFAQTPAPPAKTTPSTSPAGASVPTGGGTGAEGKLAYINISKFSAEGGIAELKAKLDALSAEFDPKIKELKADEEALNNLKNKINTQGATVSAQVRAQWADEAAEKEKTLTRKKEDYSQLAKKRQAEVEQPIYDKIGKFLEAYTQPRGIVMVLEGVASQQAGILIFAAKPTDITDDFIKEYNKANPSSGATAAVKK